MAHQLKVAQTQPVRALRACSGLHRLRLSAAIGATDLEFVAGENVAYWFRTATLSSFRVGKSEGGCEGAAATPEHSYTACAVAANPERGQEPNRLGAGASAAVHSRQTAKPFKNQ